MQRLKTYEQSIVFGNNSFIPKTAILFIILQFFLGTAIAQTDLEGGDIAILGVNANNNSCSGIGGEDVVTFVAFKDLTNGTTIDLTDNGWERVNNGLWGDSEGTLRFTYNAGTITAGTSFNISFANDLATTQANNPNWTISDLNNAPVGTLNMNSGGDQIYVMQSGTWDNMGITGDHDATYDGKILYGFNTRTFWAADGTSQQSNLHPDVDPCYYMNPTGGTTNYVNYTGPTTATTQLEWISRISNPSNWTSYGDCASYNNNPPPAVISILPSGISIECSVCSGCGTVNDILTFNLPTSGGPFNVVYTDGTNQFTLNNISNGHTENVTVTTNTTYSLVSVTDVNGCPVFSNFEGEAVITTNSGSGGSASITGGGVICTGNCSDVTITIAGGQAPYDVTVELDFPPFVNDFQFDVDMPTTNISLTICVDGLFPDYDPATNTLTIPDFIGNNVTITLVSMTDNSGCAGTVDPTPLNFDIQQTPSANPAGPLEDCDQGGNQAIFDLTSLDNAVNGNSGDDVTWYTDANASNQIGTPSAYQSSTSTVYATVTQGDCESEPVAVNLIVNPTPTANPTNAQGCDSGNGTFTFNLLDLDGIVNGGTGWTVNWYFDVGGNSPILNPGAFNTNSTTVYAAVENAGCESTTVAIILTVTPTPPAVPASAEACDEGGGIATFNLLDLNDDVNLGSPNTVTWYEDANGNNQIFTPGAYTTVSTVVYAIVGNGACFSPSVPVTLTVNPTPTANPTSGSGCDTGSGFAVFDLTLFNPDINPTPGLTITWYLDPNQNILVPDETNFTSSGGSVWAVVSNGLCESEAVEVQLTVIPAPTANPTADSACDDGSGTATFDLTELDDIVNTSPGGQVNWYIDANGSVPVPDPGNYSTSGGIVYATVTNGICASEIVEITLTLEDQPEANPASDIACDDGSGQASFDLTTLETTVSPNGQNVNWFEDNNANNPIANPDNYSTGTTTVYATVSSGNCVSDIVEITLTLEDQPEANPASDIACDDGSGQASFDLTTLETTVSPNGQNVNWFEDNNANNPIANPDNYSTGTTTVYATVSSGNCVSDIVEITLTLEDQPEANPASDIACDDGSGQASFDLTSLENTVSPNGQNVSWFEDNNANNPIANPDDYSAGTTTVYATVSNGNCVSDIVEITLTLEDQPEANPASDIACDDGSGQASFDLTTLETTVSPNGQNVNWFEDNNANNPIANPDDYSTGTTTVYATVSNGNCVSDIVEITLTLEDQPEANPASDIACDDGSGQASFDLTTLENTVSPNGQNVNWFEDNNANNPIANPDDYSTGTTTVYATVSNGNCVSDIVEITLTLEDQPEANPASDIACDDGSGQASFDLTTLENTVSPNGQNVNWFEDNNANNPIANPDDYSTGTTTVYATVSNGNCVSDIVEITLTLEDQPEANPASDIACDDGSGQATFNLTTLENTVSPNGQNVNWFEDNNANNPIVNPDDYSTGTTTVYATVSNGNCVSDIVEITLTLEDQPEANPASDIACDDGSGQASFDLTTLENTVSPNGQNVNWFEDNNANNPIANPDDYSTGSTTVYATVSNGNCVSDIVEITLTLEDQPEANPASDIACDDGSGQASFDLTTLENTVSPNGQNVNWFEDSNANNPIANPDDYSTGTTTVYATVSNGNCVSDIVEITLTLEDQPEANPTSAEACDDGSGQASFDLTSLESTVSPNGQNVNWFEDNNANNPIANPDDYSTGTTTVYATVSNGNCVSDIVEITLTLEDQPEANPTSAEACDEGNGTATFNLGSLESNVNGGVNNEVTWYSDSNATNEIPDEYPSGSTTVYAIVSNGNCLSDIVAIDLSVSTEVEASPASLEACDEGNNQATFNLSLIENTVNNNSANPVNWYEDAGATIPITPPYNASTTTIYATVGNGNCLSEVVAIDLIVSATPDAAPASAELCEEINGEAIFNLESLETTVNVGTTNAVIWSSDIEGNNLITSPYQTSSTVVYATVDDGLCTSSTVAVFLNVTDAPTAIPTTTEACEEANGQATFTLSDLENDINGGTSNEVNFFEDNNATIPIPDIFSTNSTVIYAVVGTGDCISQPVEITLNVTDAPIALPTTTEACEEANGQATFTLSDLENDINGGTSNEVNFFEDINATIPVPDIFNTNSTIIYAVVGTGNCVSQPVEITLNVTDAPTALPTTSEACEEANGQATFTLSDLENDINGGTSNEVNFFEDINATIPVPDIFNTNSTVIYAVVGTGNCVSQPVEITLNVTDIPTALPTSAEACEEVNGQATFTLSDLENNINGGTSNEVNFFEDINATISVPDIFNTNSTVIYAVVGTGNCLSQPVEITLNVTDAPTAIPTSAEACEEANGQATFTLTDLENDINGGTSDVVNFFEDSNATIPIPDIYNTNSAIIYAVVSSGNCVSQPVEINLSVIPLPEAFPSSLEACTEGSAIGTFELSDAENEVNGATGNQVFWYEDINLNTPILNTAFTSTSTTIYAIVENSNNCTSGPVPVDLNILLPANSTYSDVLCEGENVVINGTTYDINNASGTETFTGMAANGCDSIVSVLIDFYEPVVGNITGSTSICDGQSTDITFNLSGASTFNVTYSDGINPSVVLNNINDGHTISVSPSISTTFVLEEVIGLNNPCPSIIPSNSVTIEVITIESQINLLTDFQGYGVSCNGQADAIIQAEALSGEGPFSYQWAGGQNTPTLSNVGAGNYAVVITDVNGCVSESAIIVSEPPAMEVTFETVAPECFGDANGLIIIENVNGIGAPFEYSLDGEFFNPLPSLPFAVNAVPPGTYELTIQDVNDCFVSENILVESPDPVVVDLGDDITLELGDSIQLDAFVNFEVADIQWGQSDLGCTNCLDPFVFPFQTSTYSITVADSLGCVATDEITVFVDKDRSVFIPNAFSPNGDGSNDIFYIFADPSVINISKFRIFNRWGETIFSKDNIVPNDSSEGWNGDFKGQRMNPGVFVYMIEIEFVDGLVRLYKGDLTLMK